MQIRRRLRRSVEGRGAPGHAGQFRTSLPLTPLPQRSERKSNVDGDPLGEGRAFAVDDDQVAVFACATEACALSAPSVHTGAARWPTDCGRGVVVCPLHGYTYDLNTGTELGGGDAVCAFAVTAADDGTILIETGPHRVNKHMPVTPQT